MQGAENPQAPRHPEDPEHPQQEEVDPTSCQKHTDDVGGDGHQVQDVPQLVPVAEEVQPVDREPKKQLQHEVEPQGLIRDLFPGHLGLPPARILGRADRGDFGGLARIAHDQQPAEHGEDLRQGLERAARDQARQPPCALRLLQVHPPSPVPLDVGSDARGHRFLAAQTGEDGVGQTEVRGKGRLLRRLHPSELHAACGVFRAVPLLRDAFAQWLLPLDLGIGSCR
mmetsp:Transcript_20179/g.60808  ORF Transcript_20179/g.60808 Transcript_20179/m.60808 type:complete len:226 (-) Transcript_20179:5-682(-)